MDKAPHPLDRWRAADAAEAEAVRAAAVGNPAAAITVENISGSDELLLADVAPGDREPGSSMPRRRIADAAIGAIFGLLAAGWIALWIGGVAAPDVSLPAIATSIAAASGPLALLGILYMLFERGTRREVSRFGATALSMRLESRRLEEAVARVTAELDARRADLANHTNALLAEGDLAAGKLQQISMDMRDEADLLAHQAELFQNATGAARSDISGLILELPGSLATVNEVAERIGSIGGSARAHAEGLAEALVAIIARSHEADELIGAASGRLTAQIGRIETRTERTARSIEQAGATLGHAIDATLEKTEAAMKVTRSGMDLQREAIAAMIDHGRAALDEAGTAAAASIAQRLSEMSTHAEALAAQLARQDDEARRIVADLGQALGAIESRFEALGATGTEHMTELNALIAVLSEHVDKLGQAVTSGMAGARTLTERANGLRLAFDAVITNVDRDLPQTMLRVESEAARGDATMRAITVQAEQLAATVERAADRLGSADMLIDRQRGAIAGLGAAAADHMDKLAIDGDALIEAQRRLSEAVAAQADAGIEALRKRAGELANVIAESEAQLRSLSELSGEGLVEAIRQVRETAGEAAHGARTALESITPEASALVATLSEHVDKLGEAVTNGVAGARTLTDHAGALRLSFDAIIANIKRDLPQTMQRVESEAARGDATMRAITAQAEQLAATVERATDRLGSADILIDRQRDAIAGLGDQAARRMASIAAEGDAMLARQRDLSDAFAEEASARLEALRDHSNELGRLIAESESSMRSLSELSGSRLVEAILKVRETAGEAARGARAALESIIPEASESMARRGAEAIQRAFGDQVTQRIHLISDTAEAAVTAANLASEKLLTQMLSIAEATTSMTKSVAEAQAQRESAEQESVSRDVAILVENLNSVAIDVAKLLSHDVPDGAWRAYLHGDHGAFTRTAVRLLRKEEASHIARLYDEDGEFRGHVNRYIHDFEALLRRILASRDGGALAVTTISSDMGKLYVGLAQAIERLLI